MKLLDQPRVLDTLERRLAALTPETSRRWGAMTAHEMVCHLSDSFLGMLGDRAVSPAPSSALKRHLVRLIALHTPVPWPQGVPTRPEVNPHVNGTRPGAFEADRERLRHVMRRFVEGDAQYVPHPIFGVLTRREWMLWGYRHTDHHLRQFGL
jgi:hypothetical protein